MWSSLIGCCYNSWGWCCLSLLSIHCNKVFLIICFSKSTRRRLHSVSLRATSRLILPTSNLIRNWIFNVVFSKNMKELQDDRCLLECRTSCFRQLSRLLCNNMFLDSIYKNTIFRTNNRCKIFSEDQRTCSLWPQEKIIQLFTDCVVYLRSQVPWQVTQLLVLEIFYSSAASRGGDAPLLDHTANKKKRKNATRDSSGFYLSATGN